MDLRHAQIGIIMKQSYRFTPQLCGFNLLDTNLPRTKNFNVQAYD